MKASSATRQIFHALDGDGSGTVSVSFFEGFLGRNGLIRGDKRLDALFAALDEYGADTNMTIEQFNSALSSCNTLVHKTVTGTLRIPNFEQVVDIVTQVYADVEPNKGGQNAQYIPQLAEVDPEQFGISVTSIDGQHFSLGDCDAQFCIQSCSKPISYLIGLNEFGAEYVHNSVGTEPSGHAFNEMILKKVPTTENPSRAIPHNPCINAGAIMAVSMVFPDKSLEERHAAILDVWKDLSGGPDAPIGYDEATYKSESATADRNWCLGFMMKESSAFPPCFTNLSDTLELYFQVCSTLSTNKAMSIMASTLANGGLNPLTGKRVFSADHVRSVLPIMLMAGMYDYSGQWAYDIGVPAKSGVGGCVFVVVPNVCGISLFSPRLDSVGNSTRAVHGCTELVKHFAFHNFEVFSGLSQSKVDPTQPKNEAKQAVLGELLFAASQGDATALTAQVHAGVDVHQGDYDNRTALHLAASEGHAGALQVLVEAAVGSGNTAALSAADRWGGTPLSDAEHGGFDDCAKVLKDAGATAGTQVCTHSTDDGGTDSVVSDKAPEVLYAASEGDVDELIKLVAKGVDVTLCDYDRRSALHLAASNGHAGAVKYLLGQAGGKGTSITSAKDRWGNTPAQDAERGGHADCQALLA